MVAELLVHEAQIDQVAAGQLAAIEIDAFPERQFTAKVVSVSTLPDVRGSWRRDVKVYTVRVQIDGRNEDGALRPGMNSSIQIDVGTLEDIIAIPLPALEREKDRHYVWLARSEGPVAMEVTVGANNLTHVEILTGLEDGDRIYLVPPTGGVLPERDVLDDAPQPANDASVTDGAAAAVAANVDADDVTPKDTE